MAYAKRFVDEHDISFQMLWDDSPITWRTLGIPGQPAAMLFDASGKPIKKWIGPFRLEEALEAARSSA